MVRVEDLRRSYGSGPAAVHAPRGVSFEVARGELVALKGRSGWGETTPLNLVGGLDTPDGGRTTVNGTDLADLGEAGLSELRRDRVGFVFQSFGLLPILTAAENVGVSMRLRRTDPGRTRGERAAAAAWWGSPTTPSSGRRGCPAAGSSVSPSRGRSPTGRRCSSRTSRPASRTRRRAAPMVELLRAVVRGEGVTALVATHDAQLPDLADRVTPVRPRAGGTSASARGRRPTPPTCDDTPTQSRSQMSVRSDTLHGLHRQGTCGRPPADPPRPALPPD